MDCFTFVTFLSRVISLLRKEALVRFHLFLPEDLSEKLITLARKEDRNPRQQAERLLREAIEQAAQNTKPRQEYACVEK